MSWATLVDRVARRSGLPRAAVRTVLGAFVEEAEAELVAGEAVTLPGLGTLDRHWDAERTLRSVRDGRKLVLDGRWRPTFRPSERLRSALREQTPQLLRDPAHQRAWRLAETLVSDLALYHAAAVPTLAPDLDAPAVDARCASAFGPAWARARTTWAEQTPAEVRNVRDHLALAARRRWSPTN